MRGSVALRPGPLSVTSDAQVGAADVAPEVASPRRRPQHHASHSMPAIPMPGIEVLSHSHHQPSGRTRNESSSYDETRALQRRTNRSVIPPMVHTGGHVTMFEDTGVHGTQFVDSDVAPPSFMSLRPVQVTARAVQMLWVRSLYHQRKFVTALQESASVLHDFEVEALMGPSAGSAPPPTPDGYQGGNDVASPYLGSGLGNPSTPQHAAPMPAGDQQAATPGVAVRLPPAVTGAGGGVSSASFTSRDPGGAQASTAAGAGATATQPVGHGPYDSRALRAPARVPFSVGHQYYLHGKILQAAARTPQRVAFPFTVPFGCESGPDCTVGVLLGRAPNLSRSSSDVDARGRPYACIGDLVWDALNCFRRAYDIFFEHGDEVRIAKAASRIADVYLDALFVPVALQGFDWDDATRIAVTAGRAGPASSPQSDDGQGGRGRGSHHGRGRMVVALEDVERAAKLALQISVEIAEPFLLLRTYLATAEVQWLQGCRDDALRHWREARDLFNELFVDGASIPVARVATAGVMEVVATMLSRLVRFLFARGMDPAVISSNLLLIDTLLVFQLDAHRAAGRPRPVAVPGLTPFYRARSTRGDGTGSHDPAAAASHDKRGRRGPGMPRGHRGLSRDSSVVSVSSMEATDEGDGVLEPLFMFPDTALPYATAPASGVLSASSDGGGSSQHPSLCGGLSSASNHGSHPRSSGGGSAERRGLAMSRSQSGEGDDALRARNPATTSRHRRRASVEDVFGPSSSGRSRRSSRGTAAASVASSSSSALGGGGGGGSSIAARGGSHVGVASRGRLSSVPPSPSNGVQPRQRRATLIAGLPRALSSSGTQFGTSTSDPTPSALTDGPRSAGRLHVTTSHSDRAGSSRARVVAPARSQSVSMCGSRRRITRSPLQRVWGRLVQVQRQSRRFVSGLHPVKQLRGANHAALLDVARVMRNSRAQSGQPQGEQLSFRHILGMASGDGTTRARPTSATAARVAPLVYLLLADDLVLAYAPLTGAQCVRRIGFPCGPLAPDPHAVAAFPPSFAEVITDQVLSEHHSALSSAVAATCTPPAAPGSLDNSRTAPRERLQAELSRGAVLMADLPAIVDGILSVLPEARDQPPATHDHAPVAQRSLVGRLKASLGFGGNGDGVLAAGQRCPAKYPVLLASSVVLQAVPWEVALAAWNVNADVARVVCLLSVLAGGRSAVPCIPPPPPSGPPGSTVPRGDSDVAMLTTCTWDPPAVVACCRVYTPGQHGDHASSGGAHGASSDAASKTVGSKAYGRHLAAEESARRVWSLSRFASKLSAGSPTDTLNVDGVHYQHGRHPPFTIAHSPLVIKSTKHLHKQFSNVRFHDSTPLRLQPWAVLPWLDTPHGLVSPRADVSFSRQRTRCLFVATTSDLVEMSEPVQTALGFRADVTALFVPRMDCQRALRIINDALDELRALREGAVKRCSKLGTRGADAVPHDSLGASSAQGSDERRYWWMHFATPAAFVLCLVRHLRFKEGISVVVFNPPPEVS